MQVAIGPLQLHVPKGWPSGSDRPFANLCVAPPGKSRPAVFGCNGLDIWYGWDGYLPGNEMAIFERAHPGWYHATDVQPCPVDPTKGRDGLNGIRDDGLAGTESLKPVGDHTAYFYQWHAHCDSGYKFSPRAWYLPTSKVLIFDYMGNATADAVLTTATFDRGRWTFGYFHGPTGNTTTGVRLPLDEAQWLSGQAANDYARAHGMETPVPNDYLVVDPDTSTTSYPLAPDARVTSVFELAGTEPGNQRVVPVAKLVEFLRDRSHWSTPFHVHLDPSGRIDQIIEQYRP
ncbi:MAG: hypothetical protein JO074_08885 [Frankiales bacterium]|nr:hypothetical protein [Frankiales bacterium]